MYALKFQENLATTVTKPIAPSDLLKRLKSLAEELQGLDQENVDRNSLTKIASQLVAPGLVAHKNKGVNAYTACCLADILRLCAPDAPFSQNQLRTIFDCFIRQMKGLQDVDGTYYQQYHYLLESLATVESVVLLADIPDKGEALATELFRTLFEGVNRTARRGTESHIVSIMTQLIDELPHLPSEVTDLILAQFLHSRASKKANFNVDPAAYDIAKAVCNNCADRLQRNVCQYFTDIIFEATTQQEDDEDDANPRKRTENLATAHDLVYELFISAPAVLSNVIPQLESELSVDNVDCRSFATQTISAMLASINGQMLVNQFPSTYKTWAGRRNDKIVLIRVRWTEGIGKILSCANGAIRAPEVERLCVDGLLTRLVDTDEKVRSAACRVIESLDYQTAKQRLSIPVIRSFSERCRDKKHSTQEAAFAHIGKLFDSAYTDIAGNDRTAVEKFGPLVNNILHCVYVNDTALNVLLERTLFEDVLKMAEGDDQARTERLLNVVHLSDEKGRRALFALIGRNQVIMSQYLSNLLQACDPSSAADPKSGKELATKLAQFLASKMPDQASALVQLTQFMQKPDKRVVKLLKDCLDPAQDYKTINKSMKDVLKRLEQVSKPLAQTFEILLRRAAYLFFNRSIVVCTDTIARDPANGLSDAAQLVLREISNSHPTLYKAHIAPMAKEIEAAPLSIPLDNLKALSHFSKSYPDDLPSEPAFFDAMETIMNGDDYRKAKQATSIICRSPKFRHRVTKLAEAAVDDLAFGTERFLVNLAVICQCTLLYPDAIEHRANAVTTFCAKELLTKNRLQTSADDDNSWVEDDQLEEEGIAKCIAIKILGNRLRAYHNTETAAEIAAPVFKALRAVIANMGELSKAEDTPAHFRSRLRLQAARMMLKLAAFPVYEKLITADDFNQIALFAQDLEYQVRRIFLNSLHKSLSSRSLNARWHTIMFLAAHEPEPDIKLEIQKRALNMAAQNRTSPD